MRVPDLHPPTHVPSHARSPFILGEKTSRSLLLGIATALVGVLLVAQPPFLFGGDNSRIRWVLPGSSIKYACRLQFSPPTWVHGHAPAHYSCSACPVSALQPCTLPCSTPRSLLGVVVGVSQALFNSLSRITVRALR